MKAIHFLEITAQEIFYDGTGIGGTICQNIDPSYLTAAEKEKMVELKRSQGILEPIRVAEVQPRCDSPISKEVLVVPVPDEGDIMSN
ncbi:hypothetical protein GCK72_022759 [Caenorhabditis remanei]|uniref:Uncharacterized protein n=1 Tax=Caenorhabditis remanei TaxID=31234 RepID=A0A6A5FUW3_CAERE|nr:hypothetical protein GCK72_022759 [Caenorhabditis remanei]KAF1746306.1 hypothetical protein GCK72_022759 [Caenorhabditis remanei]